MIVTEGCAVNGARVHDRYTKEKRTKTPCPKLLPTHLLPLLDICRSATLNLGHLSIPITVLDIL